MSINENTPKPKPPVKKPEPKQEKKPYIRKEHLTEKPFRQNEALQKLRDSMRETEQPRPRHPGERPTNRNQRRKNTTRKESK